MQYSGRFSRRQLIGIGLACVGLLATLLIYIGSSGRFKADETVITNVATTTYRAQGSTTDLTSTSNIVTVIVNTGGALSITTNTLPSGQVGTAYSTTVAASGGTTPYVWSISAGALPTGLSLAASTGIISGTPTTAGTSNFTIKVTDAVAATATKALAITVNGGDNNPLGITTTSLSDGTVGSAYSATVSATGGTTPYSWSISAGSLPNGLSLAAATGIISGTPTVANTFSFTVKVTDSVAATATKALTLKINPADNGPLGITTTSLPDGTAGSSYSATVNATGGTTPYVWSISAGALPPGLNLNSSSGAISGTPTSAGTYNFTAKVTDAAAGTATKSLSITINGRDNGGSSPVISTDSLPGGKVGVSYSVTLAATGGKTPYTWAVASGTLPGGLRIDVTHGTISGLINTSGNFSFTVKVTDVDGKFATKDLSISVAPADVVITTANVSTETVIVSLADPYAILRQVPTDNGPEVAAQNGKGSHFNKGWTGVIKGKTDDGNWYDVDLGGQRGWVKGQQIGLVGTTTPLVALAQPKQEVCVAKQLTKAQQRSKRLLDSRIATTQRSYNRYVQLTKTYGGRVTTYQSQVNTLSGIRKTIAGIRLRSAQRSLNSTNARVASSQRQLNSLKDQLKRLTCQ